MNKLLLIATMILTAQISFADDYCDRQVTFETEILHFGVVMQMTVKHPEAIEMLQELLPYNDCYHGVCAAYYNYEKQEFVINFTQEIENGYRASGRAGSYSTFWTDNGTWLNIKSGEEQDSFLFRGCY